MLPAADIRKCPHSITFHRTSRPIERAEIRGSILRKCAEITSKAGRIYAIYEVRHRIFKARKFAFWDGLRAEISTSP
jgi:hypothetical protein